MTFSCHGKRYAQSKCHWAKVHPTDAPHTFDKIEPTADFEYGRNGRRVVNSARSPAVAQQFCWSDTTQRKSELARRMGWHMPQVDRLLELRHATCLEHAEAALGALGRKLDVHVEKAA